MQHLPHCHSIAKQHFMFCVNSLVASQRNKRCNNVRELLNVTTPIVESI
jgi:hypothetical protein